MHSAPDLASVDREVLLPARREELLRRKDEAKRVHRSLADRTHDARKDLEGVEDALRDLEKEEIKALRDQ